MNIKLLIESQVVDLLAEGNFVLQVNSNVAGSIENIVTSRSFTLICPFTTQNSLVFQHLELPSKTGDWLTSYKNAIVQVDGLQIFKGKAILLKIGLNGYEIALNFGELTALAALILDKRKISELGLTEVWKEWLNTTPFDTTKKEIAFYDYDFGIKAAFGVLFPRRAYGNPSYSIQFQYLITKISEFYGLDIQTQDLTNDYLILAENLNARVAENPVIFFREGDIGPLAVSEIKYQSELGTDYVGHRNDFYPNLREVGTSYKSLKMTDLSKLKTIRFTCGSISGSGRSWYFVISSEPSGGDEFLRVQITSAGQIINVVAADIPSGYVSQIIYVNNSGYTDGILEGIMSFEFEDRETFPLSDTLTYKDSDDEFTLQRFPTFANCDFTALEFIKECQLLTGLFTRQGVTTNKIVLEGLTRLADRSDASDLSNKLVSLIPSEFVFDDWGKVNTFQYKEYNEKFTAEYGDSEIDLTYINLPDSKALKSIFGTGYEYIVGSKLKVPQWERKEGETVFNQLPLIYAKYVYYSDPNVLIPRIRTIHFPEILNLPNYQVLTAKLLDLRVMDAEFFLSNLEFKRLNVNLPIYLKQAGKYFFIISADYDVNSSLLKARILKA